jgi:mannose-1-phosphate guanylyltransferase/phosphomannomutase
VINAHHLAERIERFVRGYRGPIEIRFVREETPLGTAGGVRNALPYLASLPFLVLYGDVLIDESLDGMNRIHARTGAEATIAVYATTRTEGKGILEMEDGLVRSFVEKPVGGHAEREEALVNAGIYLMHPSFVEQTTPAGSTADFGHDVFPAAITAGRRVAGYVLARPAIDVGTHEGLERARRHRWT